MTRRGGNKTGQNGQRILFILDLRLSKFARYIRQYGIDLLSAISKTHRGTLFAPSNDAFDVMSPQAVEKLLADPDKGKGSIQKIVSISPHPFF